MPAARDSEPAWNTVLETPFGSLRIAGTAQGLTIVGFTARRPSSAAGTERGGTYGTGARSEAAVARVLRGTAPVFHVARGAGRHAVPAAGVGGTAEDSVGRHDNVPGDCATDRATHRGTRRRQRQRAQSGRHRHPVPPGHRQQRQPDRLRRRHRDQAAPPAARRRSAHVDAAGFVSRPEAAARRVPPGSRRPAYSSC